MEYLLSVIGLLILYIFLLHFRWKRRQKIFLKTIREEEAKLIHMEKMASVGTLAAGIAHEINNPLMFLGINLEILLQNKASEDATEDVEQIVSECLDGVKRIKRIVKDLLTFSHRAQGEKVRVGINTLCDTTLRIVWNEIKYKVDLIKDYKAKSDIWTDPTQIGQVIVNLVINAYQAIADKGTIRISTYEDDGNVYIKISDTGKGISRQAQEKIFEPFFSTKGGTGLGLSVSNDIIKGCGGEIGLESKVGQGTTFTVRLSKQEIE